MELKYVLDYMKHIKKMEEQNKGSQAKTGFMKGLIDKKTEDIIATRGEKVSALQKIKIKREVESDLRRSIGRVGLTVAAIGIAVGIGAKAGNVLTEGKYNGIEITDNGVNIDTAEIGDVNVELDQNRTVTISDFEKSLKVDENNFEQIANSDINGNILAEKIFEKIDSFEEQPEEVLKYLKEMYIQKYNQENGTSYDIEDITITENTDNIKLYKDEANNGDEIIKVTEDDNRVGVQNFGLLRVEIDGETVEQGAVVKVGEEQYKYKNVYAQDEIVKEDKKVNEIGKLICMGIDYQDGLKNKEQNSIKTMNAYRNRFADAMKEYQETKAINQDEIDER